MSMYYAVAYESLEWLSDSHSSEDDLTLKWEADLGRSQAARAPSLSYRKRSELTASLRTQVAHLGAIGGDFVPPSEAAYELASMFINEMPNSATPYCRLGISDEGEINFAFDLPGGCFRAIICGEGELSYYGRIGDGEFFGDDIALRDVPFMKLVQMM